MAENFTNSTFTEEPIITPTKISVYTPLIYVAIILTTFIIFARVYRQRSLNKLTHTKPFFPPNIQKQMYYDLVSQDPRPNEKVIKAALVRWGSESIRRTIKLKECEQAINKMYQAGSIGDELFTRFSFATKFEELEIQAIAKEAESLKKGWAQKFFPLLQEVTFNEALKRRINAIDSLKKDQLATWGITQDQLDKIIANRPQLKFNISNIKKP